MTHPIRTAFVTLALAAAAAPPVLACAVCGLAGTQDNYQAYRSMTWMMSGLPLVMIGGVFYWLYRNTKG